MLLFIKGFFIGIAKIIPGVSGAMLAINFNIYEKLVTSITSFFDDWKSNLKFLLLVFSGIFLAIVLGSRVVLFFINRYYFITMFFFLGLIINSFINHFKTSIFSKNEYIYIILICLLIILLSFSNMNNEYIMCNCYIDKIMFFIGGFTEIFSSIIPGVSGTALLMLMGLYNNTLLLFSNVFNINYVINNIGIYIFFGLGMFLSLIINLILICYLIRKRRHLFNIIIYSLCLSSIILLILITLNSSFTMIDLLWGVLMTLIGYLISNIFN